jgi:hypothetical protein
MSKALARIFVCLSIFFFFGIALVGSSSAQYLAPGTLQVSRIQYDGNTNSGSNYVSPYGFPEIFNDQSGCSTGNSICDIAGIEGSIFIDQFNAEPGTALQNTLSLPSTGTPVTTPGPLTGSYITTSFSSKSEGSLNLSLDGTSLTYMGYLGNDQLSDVSNNYSLNSFYQLSPNSYTQDPSIGTPVTITAATYTNSNGNTTITLSSPVTIGAGAYFTIAGMITSGYNGFYATTNTVAETTSTLSFSLKKSLSLANCSSSATCGGTALYDPPYAFYDREVALINSTGLVSLSPYDNANSGDNPRGALTVDEQEFYTFGNSDSTLSGETLTPGVAVVPPTSQNNPGLTVGVRCGIPEQNFSYLLGTYFASDRSDETAKKHVKDNNWRGAAIATDANGHQQLYVSKGSGSNGDDGVFLVQDPNTGILPVCSPAEPDNNTATISPVFGAQATVPGGASYQTSPYLPFGFWFANPTTLYVADEGNPPTYTGGTNAFIDADAGTFTLPQLANGSFAADPYAGLEKWVYSNGSWTLAYTIQAGLNMYQPKSISGYLDTTGQPINSYTYGLRNMAGVNNNDGTVTIYAITAQFSSVSAGESDPDSLVGITDSLAATTLPANEQFTTLQTSAPGELFRGVAYIPTGNARATQTISFPNPGPVTYGTGPITLTASANSGWPIAFTLISGPATLLGNVLTITGAGSVVVQADQSGNTDYAAAASVQDTITVNPEPTSVTWATPSPITYGTALSGTQLDAIGSMAGSLVYTPPAGTVLAAGTQLLSVTFTPSNGNYAQSTGTVMLQVNPAPSTITWANPSPITYGTALSGTQLDATANNSGTFVYTPSAGAILGGGSQTLSVAFTPSTNNYSPANSSVSLTVNPASQTISFSMNAPATAIYNTSFTVAATASSTLGVTYSSAGSCTNVGALYTITSGSGTCTVTASQSGNSNYLAAAPVSESTSALRATPTVTFTGAPVEAPYNSSFTLLATTNSTAVAYITATNPSTCSLSGAYSPVTVTMLKDAGKCMFTATWGADANYAPFTATQSTTAEKATPVITWATPATVPYGTPLSSTQLDATANVGGNFTYSPGSGKIENVGTSTLKATLTPSNTNYAVTSATVSLQVVQASTSTTITSPDLTVTMNADGVATATLDFNVATLYKPTGAVNLTASTGEVCSGTLVAATGNGSCKLTFSTTGTRTITAIYGGDSNHLGSNNSTQNPQVTVTVNPHL